MDIKKIGAVLEQAKEAAIEYYELTGKPLGITGELGEYYAAQLLDLELAEARTAGFDATDEQGSKIQIKSRRLPPGKKKYSQRVGGIKLDNEWDLVALVLLTEHFDPYEIYEADRPSIAEALTKPGSKARNERGALSISKFKSIGTLVWEQK